MPVAIVTSCAGFLLAVLWMDLIFDSQIRGRTGVADEPTLASIAGYYHRATTTSQPMGTAIAVVMFILLATLGIDAIRGLSPGWLPAASAVPAGGPVVLVLTRTVPNAVRLGRRMGTPEEQTRLARAVWRDHLICAAGMAAVLVLWIGAGLR